MNDKDYIGLVKLAQLGDGDSLDNLAQLVRGRLYAYVYRIIMHEHSAQDIVQESMLEMFKNLEKLKSAEKFWPWLRGIAFNMIRRHRTKEWGRKTVSISGMGDEDFSKKQLSENEAGLANLVTQELKQTVMDAMRQLKPQYRMVLTMRCYEQMAYDQIAKLMGRSELGTRVLFCRAKKSLQKQLSRKGFSKGVLLTALILFGKMTASSEAAAASVSVTPATIKAGVAAVLLGIAGNKAIVVPLKTASVSLTAAGAFTAGAMTGPMTTQWLDKAGLALQEKLTRPVQAVVQVAPAIVPVKKYWYYYPMQTDGPVMLRLTRADSDGQEFYCQYLQNDLANYHFNKAVNTLYINNYRTWAGDLAVQRLPTDGPALRDFLSAVEATGPPMEYVADDKKGLLVVARQKGKQESSLVQVSHHYNLLDEEYFRYDWPAGAKIIDNRDAMHRRGWTYFRIEGQIRDKEVSGTGRLPFVFAACEDDWPWLRLKVGNKLKIIHDFAGLPRPWMGLHTMDTVRRDAAGKQIWFQTQLLPASDKARVTLTYDSGKMVYTIDTEADIIDKIEFFADGQKQGQLRFSYLQDIDKIGSEFVEPDKKSYQPAEQEPLGISWLVQLAELK